MMATAAGTTCNSYVEISGLARIGGVRVQHALSGARTAHVKADRLLITATFRVEDGDGS
jgi:hypothetical protein